MGRRKMLLGHIVPTRVTQILKSLNAKPVLRMPEVSSLRFLLTTRNNYGPRHFANETLPRIRWANQALPIEFSKAIDPKTKKAVEGARSEMEITLKNGKREKFDIEDKPHRTILEDLMKVAGAPEWHDFARTGQNPVVGPLSTLKRELRMKAQKALDESSKREGQRAAKAAKKDLESKKLQDQASPQALDNNNPFSLPTTSSPSTSPPPFAHSPQKPSHQPSP